MMMKQKMKRTKQKMKKMMNDDTEKMFSHESENEKMMLPMMFNF